MNLGDVERGKNEQNQYCGKNLVHYSDYLVDEILS